MFIGIYVQQISGERLQDHWSSGLDIFKKIHRRIFLKMLFIREIPELQVNNEKVPRYWICFPALSD